MEKNNWLGELAAQVLQVKEDMEEIALSGQYPVVVMLRSYELLEKLGNWEEMEYNMQQYGKGESAKFYEALELYCNSYLANGERLYAIMDMEQIRMKAAAYMGPWKRKHNEAMEGLEKATALWEMAKIAHKAQQEGNLWEKWKTLRQVRKMAGFRLERRRTGNFVTRTFELMQQAQARAREAELKLYEHNVEYKCTPDSYLRIYEVIQGKIIGKKK
jgi:hypothetical protein